MTLYVNGVEVGGGGGGAPSGPAGGDLGGMYPDPTVTDLTIASEARGDLLRRGASAWSRLAIGTSGKVLTSDGTDPVWSNAAVASTDITDATSTGRSVLTAASQAAARTAIGAGTGNGDAVLAAANVFTAKQTFRFESGNYGQARICAAVRHRCSAVGQNFGAALAFESEEIGGAVVEMGYVRARRNDDHRWVELLPNRSNGTPPTAGLRCHSVGNVDAIYGVEAVVAASGGSPVLRPCVEGITTPDVDLTLTGLGAGGVVLPNARPLVDTVANITALTRPAGTMGFATDASGGAKPCWSTGSGWILASGSALT